MTFAGDQDQLSEVPILELMRVYVRTNAVEEVVVHEWEWHSIIPSHYYLFIVSRMQWTCQSISTLFGSNVTMSLVLVLL